MQKPTVFIHTNDKQGIGAYLGAYSMKRASKHPNEFDVKLLRLEETPHLLKQEGRTYKRKGADAVWRNADLQSFTPLRRMVPQLMNFQGRAVVTDPDIFAVGDIYDLLTMDMGGKAIMVRNIREGYKGGGKAFYASSVMLLDCAKLTHWRWDEEIEAMFSGKLDYGPWIGLTTEDPDTIGELGEEWNSFDKLTSETILLHCTERSTQPWKTGLPVDYDTTIVKKKPAKGEKAKEPEKLPEPAKAPVIPLHREEPTGLLGRVLGRLRPHQEPVVTQPDDGTPRYQPHPDPAQELLVFRLLKDALEEGAITEDYVKRQMAAKDVRPDAFALLRKVGYTPASERGWGRLLKVARG